MANETKADETAQEFMATLRASVGTEVFEAASPTQTIRQTSTAANMQRNMPTVRASTILGAQASVQRRLEARDPVEERHAMY